MRLAPAPAQPRILDNLPVATVRPRQDDDGKPMKAYERGFYVGFGAQLEVRRCRGGRKL